jgi:hypothetical protein
MNPCDVQDDDAVMPTFFERRQMRASKMFRCCECREHILPGQTYVYDRGKWDGDWTSYRTCLGCARVRMEHGHGVEYGRLREHLRECLDIDYLDPTWEPKEFRL